MATPAPRLITLDYRVNQLIWLGITLLLALAELPFFLFGRNSGFALVWFAGLLFINAPVWLWPARTVLVGPAGFTIKALLRITVRYPAGAFVGVEDARSTRGGTKAYLAFADGQRYPATFTQPVERSYSFLIFEDHDRTVSALNRYIRTALAEFQPVSAPNQPTA